MQHQSVKANGIDIHYVEEGSGPPVLLLHGGVVSANPLWGEHPFAYASHVAALARRFRVLALDTRGCGRTRHTAGPITFDLLAEDVLAFIEAMSLARPALVGFSEGAGTATIAAIKRPGAVGALVNDAGYDLFNPDTKSAVIMRTMLGGSPTATRTDVAAAERFFQRSDMMKRTFELLKVDQDEGQGRDHWKTYLELAFERTTTPPGYTFEDMRRVTAPSLVVTGDRDDFCSLEEGVIAFRSLKLGQLAVVPNTGHLITRQKMERVLDFLDGVQRDGA
ncbi:MAG TPA: alpha/beta hydrolase [Polyangiaceae bacterium]|nr:alpha/beta hydrolase [Polyangiaceae bacterium]